MPALPPPWIFTDIDGVLNNEALFGWFKAAGRPRPPHEWLDPVCLRHLEWLVRTARARLVITSNWRRYLPGAGELGRALARGGLESSPFGTTPLLAGASGGAPPADLRAREVAAFLAGHPPAPYVILEDVEGWCRHFPRGRYVRTEPSVGLTRGDVIRALGLLNDQREAT